MFLGENAVSKLLNGRKLNLVTINEINKLIDTQITPRLRENRDSIVNKVKKMYGDAIEKDNVLKDE